MYHSVQKPSPKMSPAAVIFKVVYLRLLAPVGRVLNPDLLKLTAKFGNDEFSVWVKPTKSLQKQEILAQNGLKANKNGELFLKGERLPTVDLETALMRFREFITSSPEPVLLVTHSSGVELMILFKAIRKTMMVDVFKGVIQRAVDTVPIFEKRFPNLKKGTRLTLNDLISYTTMGENKRMPVLETSYYLECLEWLVTENRVTVSELIETSESYENFLPSSSAALFHNPQTMQDLLLILSKGSLIKLRKANISIAILKELSQEDNPQKFYNYVEKQCVKNGVNEFSRDTILKIFNLLKKPRPRDHGARSVNTGQERSADEPGPSTTSHGKQYNDYLSLEQQKEIVDEPVSIMEMEEPEASYDRDHSSVRQETRRINYSSTEDQEKLGDIAGLLTEEQRERFDNDYAFSLEPQELISATDSYSEGREAVNDYPFSYQFAEPTIDWNSFAEEQEPPYDGTHRFTNEEEERLADAISMIEESGALGNQGHSLTRYQRE